MACNRLRVTAGGGPTPDESPDCVLDVGTFRATAIERRSMFRVLGSAPAWSATAGGVEAALDTEWEWEWVVYRRLRRDGRHL